ncbi:hypothetical protein [Corynebacterium cystitidis]|uniref:SMI1 / KNR4 family (SUKH-1) n=1 Tax=Corynebacterium cystitidis DSM 20524 TaxID=1121357 RepID=A0A1H9WK98_9CORY|nr:hypothetical protein [Corynebacterium cystitidis]WJY83431.1 hypothetical protein CCYS_12720 [Corynebacterium cystitidis DSM 20524]SES34295.1 hypothetical protein SAMN05661109_02781 [Corynebacterium cystitidis DSM 20524]SNV61693.1 Uncharacterised protein [Corynebacterium cystitidis]
MIDKSDLDGAQVSYFYGDGFSQDEIETGFKRAPEWIPDEYFSFWKQFTEFNPPSVIFFTPAPYGAYPNAFEGFSDTFWNSGFKDSERFFPVAYADALQWGVFEKLQDGSVFCGMYDFVQEEYYMGPFNSFLEWIKNFR